MQGNNKHYFRTHRRALGLSQGQLAYLLGYRDIKSISRIERNHQLPHLSGAIGSSVIFRDSVERLYPCLYQEVEDIVVIRIHRLLAVLRADSTKRQAHALAALETLLDELADSKTRV